MNGVTILNAIHECNNIGEIIVGVVFLLISIVGLCGIVHGVIEDRACFDAVIWAVTIVMAAILCFSAVVGIITIVQGATLDETAYEVTIDENVSLKEFNEKYEIVEQRGDIYVVKEIES